MNIYAIWEIKRNRVPVLSRLPACELNKAIDRQPSYRSYNNIFFTNLAQFFICLYFTNLITFLLLLLLFVFISLKHNKLQMIYWGYHNCYGNLELSTDLWFKAKHGFIVNTATDEKKNPRTTGFKGTKVDIGHQYA